ncbi:MAG: serine/threonine protein kinase [Planctomycetes bacterium]|nr:serine/threonine protein kinase [Planctomycetota bacterium]
MNVGFRQLAGRCVAGRYVLRRPLGEGAFGVVWLADQLFFGEVVRRVAVKVCKEAASGPAAARALFADALQLATALDAMPDSEARACMVQVHDVGVAEELGQRGYMVMEFVEGTTLATQFRSHERVPANQLLVWMRQACRGLAGLHALRPPLVHRDLKPENMLLGLDLRIRIVDFGLAARMTAANGIRGAAGTRPYMAPETLLGRSLPASDVWSIGVMLYEGLSGRLPFAHLQPPAELPPEAHVNWLHDRIRTAVLAPPSTANPTVGAALDALVARCLAFDASGRFKDAVELAAALGERLDRGDVVAVQARAARTATGGDAGAACRQLEQGIAAATQRSDRYRMLRQLAELLEQQGNPAAAAARLEQAWETVRDSAVLRTRVERAALLREVARCYAAAGNAWFAQRFSQQAVVESNAGGGA